MSKRTNVYGEFKSADKRLVIYLLAVGYRITRCETNDASSTEWTIAGVPEFDLEILEDEAKSPETAILFHDCIAATRVVWATEAIARKQCGLFCSPAGWGKDRWKDQEHEQS